MSSVNCRPFCLDFDVLQYINLFPYSASNKPGFLGRYHVSWYPGASRRQVTSKHVLNITVDRSLSRNKCRICTELCTCKRHPYTAHDHNLLFLFRKKRPCFDGTRLWFSDNFSRAVIQSYQYSTLKSRCYNSFNCGNILRYVVKMAIRQCLNICY